MARHRFGCEFEFSSPWERVEKAVRKIIPEDKLSSNQCYSHSRGNSVWILKTDASTSAELTTPICEIDQIEEVCEVAQKLSERHLRVTKKDGFHVHVSKEGMGVRNTAYFWADCEKQLMLTVPKHRRENEYCERIVKWRDYPDNWKYQVLKKVRDHHSAFHFNDKLNTFEFRIAEGTLDGNFVKNWINFCLLFLDASKKHEPGIEVTSLRELFDLMNADRSMYSYFLKRKRRYA